MHDSKIILSIETSQKRGSVSLFREALELGNWSGDEDLSRSQDLLIGIDGLLSAHGLGPRDIDMIAASLGPGSFTGLRVGISVAKGLSFSCGCALRGVPLMEAILVAGMRISGKVRGNVTVVALGGPVNLFLQKFVLNGGGPIPGSQILVTPIGGILAEFARAAPDMVFSLDDAAVTLRSLGGEMALPVYSIKGVTSRLIGEYAIDDAGLRSTDLSGAALEPIYLREV